MAVIHKVGKEKVSDHSSDDRYYSEIFDNQTIEDNNLLSIISAINKFNIYLANKISDLQKLDDEDILKSFLNFNKSIKTEIKNIENSFGGDKLKLLFNKYAVSKLSRELSSIEKVAKNKIGKKKIIAIKGFLKYLTDSSRANYFDLEIINENLSYYKNYLALLIGNAPIDIVKEAKVAIYGASIEGAIEAENHIVATKLLNIDFINEAFSDAEISILNEKISTIKNQDILKILEAELIKIDDVKEIKSKINELEKANYINNIDADNLFQKICGNIKLNKLVERRRYNKALTENLLNIFNQVYNSSVDFDKLYNEVADKDIYRFIMKVVENSSKDITQSVASEREVIFNNLKDGIYKRYIIDINSLIHIKDVYEKMDITNIIKLIKMMIERDAKELNISE